ncbi:MAG TPA: NAD(P)-dependent oxidoreductase [Candidatus Binataceae bacterium]|nr:NAD(P)-dependent oxidoreductase [Candidatus Binataceae bacterium]
MKVLLAGATGAIGRPLIRGLKQHGHSVFGLVRSAESTRTLAEMGAEAVIGDALDAASVRAAIARVRPDAVINELTSLPRHYTPDEMKAAGERDSKVRREGNLNLLAAMRESDVPRYVLQASGFWYAPGPGLADESCPLAVNASPGVAASVRTYLELESTAFRAAEIDCVAMRYGFFYGPGTWYTNDGDMGEQVRRRQVPIIGGGEGVSNFVHIEDAASATVAALECTPGPYNIVDDNPSPQRVWLPAFARACGAPEPPQITEQEALSTSGADSVYYATCLRGASNEKARRELNFRPRPLEWLRA